MEAAVHKRFRVQSCVEVLAPCCSDLKFAMAFTLAGSD